MGKKKIRNSSIELLRIVAMILIVMHHYCIGSNFSFNTDIGIYQVLMEIFSFGGKIGVNIFVLIMGYFGIKNNFKIKKVFLLMMSVLFYSILGLLLAYVFNCSISTKDLMNSIFPTLSSLYWFFTTYIIVYILSPYINKFINCLSKNEFLKILFILLVLLSIIPVFTIFDLGFSNYAWFIFVYMTGAYIYKYINNINKKYLIISLISSLLIIFTSIVIFKTMSVKYSVLNDYILYFAQQASIFAFIASITLFLLFKDINITPNKFINKIAGTTFGIYLFHSNKYLQNFLWNDFFIPSKWSNGPYLIFHFIISILIVFIIGIIIDSIKKYTYDKIVDKIYECLRIKIKGTKLYIKFQNLFSNINKKEESL